MLYLLEVNALAAASVFAVAGLIIFALFAWQEAKAYAAARQRIANSFEISRSVSRTGDRDRFGWHRIQ